MGEFVCNMFSLVNVIVYVKIICECVIICELIGVVNEIVEVGYNLEGCDSVDILDMVESKVFEIVECWIGELEGL